MGANPPILRKGEEKVLLGGKADSAFQKPCCKHQKPSVQWTKMTKSHPCSVWKLKCQRWVTIADWLLLILLSELGSHAHGTKVLHPQCAPHSWDFCCAHSVLSATRIYVLNMVCSMLLGLLFFTQCVPCSWDFCTRCASCSWDFCSAHGVIRALRFSVPHMVCTVLLFSPFP